MDARVTPPDEWLPSSWVMSTVLTLSQGPQSRVKNFLDEKQDVLEHQYHASQLKLLLEVVQPCVGALYAPETPTASAAFGRFEISPRTIVPRNIGMAEISRNLAPTTGGRP